MIDPKTTETQAPQTCEAVVERVKVLAEDALSASKEELDMLKQTFYKLHHAAVEAAREAYVAVNETTEGFKADTSLEEEYKAAMSVIREKRAEQQREGERVREENFLRKEAILDRIQGMLDNADTEQASYNDFKALQQEWKEVGEVPAPKMTDQWKRYQQLTERFYDILKLNIEFREYDFKKNLEAKLRLCEAAERLAEESDVISAFHQLQKLHDEYRETGPVAKEMREEVWKRFKEASSVVNKRHQQHFEDLKKGENEIVIMLGAWSVQFGDPDTVAHVLYDGESTEDEPGITDSVSLIFNAAPEVQSVQTNPNLDKGEAQVQVTLKNRSDKAVTTDVTISVYELGVFENGVAKQTEVKVGEFTQKNVKVNKDGTSDDFEAYMYHMLNVDRMSLESKARAKAVDNNNQIGQGGSDIGNGRQFSLQTIGNSHLHQSEHHVQHIVHESTSKQNISCKKKS